MNDSLRVDFDEVIAGAQVLVVKGALGAMGSGNTSVLMQLLVGMLDAALARSQDSLAAERRTTVALKVDEAPLVLNRGFAETMALKRSAGLETVACWQTDAQWTEREVRAQLDALFAHRVYFATASVDDARDAASLTMAEFSDTVRPGTRNLSDLGRPDVRLHLPRHSAVASWVTPEGRQAPFVGRTLPLSVDEQRVAFHAAKQAERGGRYRDDLSQPHWGRGRVGAEPGGSAEEAVADPGAPVDGAKRSQLGDPSRGSVADTALSPDVVPVDEANPESSRASRPADAPASKPAESYRELVDLDAAHSMRWAKPAITAIELELEPLDVEILVLIASMRHVLSSQIHRRFNDGRAATTTQRRLKRLSDAGLVARFQFHRRDGGGMPMCYSITPLGRRLSGESSTRTGPVPIKSQGRDGNDLPASLPNRQKDDRLLRQARHDVRVAGWALAVERVLSAGLVELMGPEESVLVPPSRSTSGQSQMLALADLCLPEGRAPHDFLRTADTGTRLEVERFQSIRPDVTLRTKGCLELLVELDDRLPEGVGAAKLERYDHFLSGWSAHIGRYARPAAPLPLVVFVCRDRSRAHECARRADRVLTACRAYAGEYPSDWEYPGRERIVFAAERDAHEGVLKASGVARLPPDVRVVAAGGDPRGRDPLIEPLDTIAIAKDGSFEELRHPGRS